MSGSAGAALRGARHLTPYSHPPRSFRASGRGLKLQGSKDQTGKSFWKPPVEHAERSSDLPNLRDGDVVSVSGPPWRNHDPARPPRGGCIAGFIGSGGTRGPPFLWEPSRRFSHAGMNSTAGLRGQEFLPVVVRAAPFGETLPPTRGSLSVSPMPPAGLTQTSRGPSPPPPMLCQPENVLHCHPSRTTNGQGGEPTLSPEEQKTEHLSVRMAARYKDALAKIAERKGLGEATLARQFIRSGIRRAVDEREGEEEQLTIE